MSSRRHPKLFIQPQKHLTNLAKKIEQDTLSAGAKAIQQDKDSKLEVKKMPKYLQVTEKRMNNLGVIDLKPFFRQSSKAKKKANGGWYLTVPIRRKVRSMSRREERNMQSQNISPDSQRTILSPYLYDNRQVSDSQELNYTPKSNNITKRKIGNNRHSYTAFRTVSDKSPANSWVINRSKINKEDTSKTMVKNVDRLMKWKMKNGFQ